MSTVEDTTETTTETSTAATAASTTTATAAASPVSPAAEGYIAAVAAALLRAGVAEPERQELLDDLVGHLAELEAEDGETLEAELGPPTTYAAELLASAGIDVSPPPTGVAGRVEQLWRSGVMAVRSRVDRSRIRAVRSFLGELRVGWWLVRGWAAVALLATWGAADRQVFPLPDPFNNGFLSFLTLTGAVVASVRIGRRYPGWLNRAATAVGVLGVAIALVDGGPRIEYRYDHTSYPSGVLLAPNGNVVDNIWPYDAEGRPLENVYLFDQNGEPISLGEIGSGGLVIPGLFPQPRTMWDYNERTGAQREVPAPRPDVSIPRLPGSAPTTTTVPAETTTTTTAPPADPAATTTTVLVG